jgi:hypothetical protein
MVLTDGDNIIDSTIMTAKAMPLINSAMPTP